MPSTADLEGVWHAQDTTPSAIEAALRNLLVEGHQEDRAYAPARVCNLVVVVDRQFKGEIANRLERVGRYHPSRTVLCAVEPRRSTMDAWAQMTCEAPDGDLAVAAEQIEIEIGEKHVKGLDAIVDPLIVTDLTTIVWAPHGHEEAVDALRRLIQVVLLDSAQQLHARDAIKRAVDLSGDAYIVDLAWLRSTPWRERIAATFDPEKLRPDLRHISRFAIRHHPESGAAALLLAGWLGSRLGWEPSPLVARHGALIGKAHSKRQDIALELEPAPEQSVRGLAVVEVETASGRSLQLARGPGGLRAHYKHTRGIEREWTVLGASRGEAGILGEGIRQALLRDPTYRPALEMARALAA